MSVPGLNGVHTWNGDVALNDTVWPHVRLSRIPGLHALPELEDQRDNPVGMMGELPRRSLSRGKTVVYEGTLEARSQAELDDFRSSLMQAFMVRDSRMVIAPKSGAGVNYFFDARVTALDIPEEYPDVSTLRSQTLGFQRAFTLGLRLSDPRFYEIAVQGPFQTAVVVAQGGLALPWVFPVAIPDPGSASGAVNIVNGGTAPTPPLVEMWGPALNPGLVSDTVNEGLRLALSLAAGQFVQVDFRNRTLLLNGNEDVSGQIDRDRSTWWDQDTVDNPAGLIVGAQSLRYVADNLNDPAFARVSFNNAVWG